MKIYRRLVCAGLISLFLLPGVSAKSSTKKIKGVQYPTYKGLVMVGYQAWFTTDKDGSKRSWTHYYTGRKDENGKRLPFGAGAANIELWPDVSEYKKVYETPFIFKDGKPAFLFSSADESTIDLHFKWMKDYGIDGCYLQLFLSSVVKPNPQRDEIFGLCLKAAKKYGRAFALMYDLSGLSNDDHITAVASDWKAKVEKYNITDTKKNPSYLYENGRPVVALWGVGFKAKKSTPGQFVTLMDRIDEFTGHEFSYLLGVSYDWRKGGGDCYDAGSPELQELYDCIRRADIIMSWAVGRYNQELYEKRCGETLVGDVEWCEKNNILYVPCVFPGFSWKNMKQWNRPYDFISRNHGDFFWSQVAGAQAAGAKALYVAMFDELDEATAIFKCLRRNDVPLNDYKGDGGTFIGIDDELQPDHYLWLTGEAGKWIRGGNDYSAEQPVRK